MKYKNQDRLTIYVSPEFARFVRESSDKLHVGLGEFIEAKMSEGKTMTAILHNNVDGTETLVHSTTDHPSCSYGKAVWVDTNGNAYMQVGMEHLVPMYKLLDVKAKYK